MTSIQNWLRSSWRNGTRAYTIELRQDFFQAWHVICRWGKHTSRGSREKCVIVSSYEEAIALYEVQRHRRQKRGYQEL